MNHSFPFPRFGGELELKLRYFLEFFSFFSILESTLIRRLFHFVAWIFSYMHQQALNIAVTILHHLKTPRLKKCYLYFEIAKCDIRMLTFIHLNSEWKHSNLRLRPYLLRNRIIDKYKMIAKVCDHWCKLTYH